MDSKHIYLSGMPMRRRNLLLLLLLFVLSSTIVDANDRDAEKDSDSSEAVALVTEIAPGKRLYGKLPEFAAVGNATTFDLSPDGKKIAFLTQAGVRFWDIEKDKLDEDDEDESFSGEAKTPQQFHSPGQHLQYSADGTKIFTSRWSNAALVLKTEDGEDEAKLADASNVRRQVVEVRDAKSGEVVRTIEPETDDENQQRNLRFMIPTPDGDKILVSYGGQESGIYDTDTGELVQKLKHNSWVQTAVFDHKGERLIDGNGQIIDVETGETEGKLPRMIFGSYLSSINFHPKRNVIAASEWNKGVMLYDLEEKEKLELEKSGAVSGQYMYLTDFSRDGSLLAAATYINHQMQTGKPTIVVWDVESGKIVDEIEIGGGHMARFRISTDNKFVFVKAHSQVGMSKFEIDGDRKKQKQTGPSLSGAVQAFHFTGDNEQVIASPAQGSAVVFDLETGKTVRTIATQNTTQLESSESGRYVILGSNYGGFKIHDRKSGKSKSVQVKTWSRPSLVSRLGGFLTRKKNNSKFENFGVGAITVTDDQKHAMVALRSNQSFRWQKYRLDNGKSVEQKRFKFDDYWDCEEDDVKNKLTSFQWIPSSVTISPDGQYLAVVGPDKTVNVLDVETGNESLDFSVDEFSHGSKMFFSRDSQNLFVIQKNKVRIFDLESGEEDEGFSVDNQTHQMGISPNRTKIAFLNSGSGVSVYDLEAGEKSFSCKIKEAYVSIAVSDDGEKLALARSNCQFEVWDKNELEE